MNAVGFCLIFQAFFFQFNTSITLNFAHLHSFHVKIYLIPMKQIEFTQMYETIITSLPQKIDNSIDWSLILMRNA